MADVDVDWKPKGERTQDSPACVGIKVNVSLSKKMGGESCDSIDRAFKKIRFYEGDGLTGTVFGREFFGFVLDASVHAQAGILFDRGPQ